MHLTPEQAERIYEANTRRFARLAAAAGVPEYRREAALTELAIALSADLRQRRMTAEQADALTDDEVRAWFQRLMRTNKRFDGRSRDASLAGKVGPR